MCLYLCWYYNIIQTSSTTHHPPSTKRSHDIHVRKFARWKVCLEQVTRGYRTTHISYLDDANKDHLIGLAVPPVPAIYKFLSTR